MSSSNNSNAAAGAGSGGSSTSRLEAMFALVPLTTRFFLALNIGIHILIFLFTLPLGLFAISYTLVAVQHEFYRIVTSAFVHVNLLHIGMNMMTLFQLGPSIEFQFGTLQFFLLTLWSVFTIGFCYLFVSWLTASMLRSPGYLASAGVGFSGVLFCYAVIESFHSREPTRSIFGIFNVPSKVYPFILLIILQIILPVSFFGHLSGCIIGLLTVCGVMGYLFPSQEMLLWLESASCMSGVTQWSCYVRVTDKSIVLPEYSTCANCYQNVSCAPVLYVFTLLWQLLEALLRLCPSNVREWFAGFSASGSRHGGNGNSDMQDGVSLPVRNPVLSSGGRLDGYRPVRTDSGDVASV